MSPLQTAESAEKTGFSEESAAPGAAVVRADGVPMVSEDSSCDPDLLAVVAAWPSLSEATKAGILAMIGAAKRPA